MKKGKASFVALALLGALLFGGGKAKADSLDFVLQGPGVFSAVRVQHLNGAIEPSPEIDNYDVPFLQGMPPCIDFYIQNPFGNYSWDARGPNSTTDFVLEISGRGLGSTTKTVNINAYFDPAMDEGNFDWKNLIVELYNNGDINNPANRLGIYDGHRLVNGTQSIPQLDVHEGLSYQLVVKPRNYADLDLNNKVNFKDHAILANQWQATGQGEESTWGNYTNIDRDEGGNVGMGDFSIFVSEWLWDANDPNTW